MMRRRLAITLSAITVLAGAGFISLVGASSGTTASPFAPACAPSARHVPASTRAGAAAAVVPPGPSQVLICNYYGIEQPGVYGEPTSGLAAHRLVADPGTVSALAGALNSLAAPLPGPVACPADLGSVIVAEFRYPSGPDDPVSILPGGCSGVTNGHAQRQGTPAVIARFSALAPVPANATIRGHLELCGGPAPGGCRTMAFSICGATLASCVKADRVAIVRGHTVIARIRLRHARFRAVVPPGRYTLRLLGEGRHIHNRVMQTLHVKARPGRTAAVTFIIAVP